MPRANAGGAASGVTIIDKPSGSTSFDMVTRARRFYATRRIGHAGTLDPMATGVLVLLVGEATKLSAHLSGASKEYEAVVSFGLSTDTSDAHGTPLASPALSAEELARRVDSNALRAALDIEHRRTLQQPPQHSALKVEGRRAYALARGGVDFELPPRPVNVECAELLEFSGTAAKFRLHVSKGYYVRAFARDLSLTLGVPGHLSALRRTRSGCFAIDEAEPWPPILPRVQVTVEDAVRRALPFATLTDEGAAFARDGKLLSEAHFQGPPPRAIGGWFAADGQLVALGEPHGSSFKVARGFTWRL